MIRVSGVRPRTGQQNKTDRTCAGWGKPATVNSGLDKLNIGELRLGNIKQADVLAYPADHAGICDRCPDATSAYNTDLLLVLSSHTQFR